MKKSKQALFLILAGFLWLALTACVTAGGGAHEHMMLEDKEPGRTDQEVKDAAPAPIPTEPSPFERGPHKHPSAMLQDENTGEMKGTSLPEGKAQTSRPMPMPVEPK